ncbi:Hint domain-containing protein [Sulfitobacter aestuariivivens]|uniref:Hint domain-containing protein n=1 Tax=Sulfitobacter aestuariivivens TaxID=2766981 RepID=A0A927D5A9_9RHOB|nr:Hint domain-containing protein [Sulfitobacter aestuariivivens]MBD3664498.1 Hint domain-containing protein [Sulfitobacter aestuariivivens]
MKPNTVGRVDGNDRLAGQFTPYAAVDTGLLHGTSLLSQDGEIPVEYLSVGDKLITRDTGLSKVIHIQRSTRSIQTISLAAGSLGHTRPERDAMLAGDQMVLIRDWRARALFNSERALVAARALVDGEFITDLGLMKTTLYQIFCDGPHILYAEGLELGTADASRARGTVLHAA